MGELSCGVDYYDFDTQRWWTSQQENKNTSQKKNGMIPTGYKIPTLTRQRQLLLLPLSCYAEGHHHHLWGCLVYPPLYPTD